jgi:hypothetical protein
VLRWRRRAEVGLIVGFACLLAAPMIARPGKVAGSVIDLSTGHPPRLRPFAEISRLAETKILPTKQLVSGYNQVCWALFSQPSRSVVRGRDGWFFYDADAADDGWGMSDYQGQAQPSSALIEDWRQEAIARHSAFSSLGIEYLLILAPDKQVIYPEYLPSYLPVHPSARMRIDAFVDGVGDAFSPPVADLRASLLAAKGHEAEPLYLRTDTHWNPLGAWHGYAALRKASPRLMAAPFVDVSSWTIREEQYSGDLLHLVQMDDRFHESLATLIPDRDYPAVMVDGGRRLIVTGTPLAASVAPLWKAALTGGCTTRVADPHLPTAVIFTDSFGMAMAPFLAQDFREALFIKGPLDFPLVRRKHPDLVLQLRVQRYLDKAMEPMAVQ